MKKTILAASEGFLHIVTHTDLKTRFKKAGFSVIPHLDFNQPCSDALHVWGIVVGARKFGKKEMACFPNLKVISPFGVGVDHIDCKEAKERGVLITNAPGTSSRSVAELAFAYMLALARRLNEFDRMVKGKTWDRMLAMNLHGKTLGIIGLGHIGKEMAKMARGIGMNVLAHDLIYDEKFLKDHAVQKTSLQMLYKKSDCISIHTPLTEHTREMLNKKSFALMKRGVLIMNTARGPIIDFPALAWALKKGIVGAAALDVFPEEPPFSAPYFETVIKNPRVIATPHVAAATPESHYAVAERILKNFIAVDHEKWDDVIFAERV